MEREDFKAEEIELEPEVETEEVELEEVKTDDVETEESGEQEQVEKPFWMQEDSEEDNEPAQTVPLAVLLKEKGKRKERDSEIEELRQTVEELKAGKPISQSEPIKRPRITDFDSDEAYEDAMDKWEQQQRDQLVEVVNTKQNHSQTNQRVQQEVEKFYTNAEKLLKEHAIAPDVYVSASNNVIESLDKINPGQGKALFHALVATVGDHAEKIVFHVGRNKGALAEFQSQLLADPSGSRALVYLGSLKAKVSGNNKKSSRAPSPAANVNGGSIGGNKAAAEQRKYNAAHKDGNVQKAYNIKSAARKGGIDVSKW